MEPPIPRGLEVQIDVQEVQIPFRQRPAGSPVLLLEHLQHLLHILHILRRQDVPVLRGHHGAVLNDGQIASANGVSGGNRLKKALYHPVEPPGVPPLPAHAQPRVHRLLPPQTLHAEERNLPKRQPLQQRLHPPQVCLPTSLSHSALLNS